MSTMYAIEAAGLHKRFARTHALRGLDMRVAVGTVCGMLGPNGAGKTTAVRVFTTLTRPDEGTARVAGYDVVREPGKVRWHIGLAGQHAAIDEKLSGRDNLRMFGRLYHLSERQSRQRADELLGKFGLADVGSRMAETYSGGMRRRLDLIASLLIAPPVLFLDEPTTGLDPASRNQIWASVRELAAGGTTVMLTTQYLDEADQLADDIVVVDHGMVIASGAPAELKAGIGSRLEVIVHDPADLPRTAEILARVPGAGEPALTPEHRQVSAPVRNPASGGAVVLTETVRGLDHGGVTVDDLALRQPTLDEVFLQLTGGREESGVARDRSGEKKEEEP